MRQTIPDSVNWESNRIVSSRCSKIFSGVPDMMLYLKQHRAKTHPSLIKKYRLLMFNETATAPRLICVTSACLCDCLIWKQSDLQSVFLGSWRRRGAWDKCQEKKPIEEEEEEGTQGHLVCEEVSTQSSFGCFYYLITAWQEGRELQKQGRVFPSLEADLTLSCVKSGVD